MQLVNILMFLVAAMALMSGVVVVLGVGRSERTRALWFLLAGIGITTWCTTMSLFFMARPGEEAIADLYIHITYTAALIITAGVFGYNCWVNRAGKVASLLVLAIATAFAIKFNLEPSLLYSNMTLSASTNNNLTNADSWFVYAYFGFIGASITAYLIALAFQIKRAANKNLKNGLTVSFVGWLVNGIIVSVFAMILPVFAHDYSLSWVGPLSMGIVLLTVYFSLLRYRLLILRSNWLAIVSYAMIFILATMAYMVLFFVVFTALFKIPNPSMSVLALNVVMVAIVLLLLPVISEVGAAIKSMIFVRSVDMVYIIKRINRLAGQKVDLKNLAEFLADRMHFDYVGFLIDGRLWGSEKIDLADNELVLISKMKHSTNYIWLYVDDALKPVFERSNLAAVAQMRNARGQVFGHILIGRPLGEIEFAQRDLTQVESIVNLVAAIVDSGEKKVCINVNGQKVCGVPESEAKKISGG
ncbi:hypothetical protein FWG86_00430 [Candidatus Saccharibacteria bacterium]|nr:hypothetical protein [Candidatus Saccharibacteria bacterium]